MTYCVSPAGWIETHRKKKHIVSRLLIGTTMLLLSYNYSQAATGEYRRETVASQRLLNKPAQRSDDLVLCVVVTLTSGTSWSVPANFNPANNTIECYGGGGGGGSSASGGGYGSGLWGAPAGGGGSGSYAKNTNQAGLSGSIPYSIGGGGGGGSFGFGGGNGGDTNFNSGQCVGKGGTGSPPGVGTSGGAGPGGAGGVLGTGTTRIVGANGSAGTGGAPGTGGNGGVGTGGFGNGGRGAAGTEGTFPGSGTAGVAGRIVITYTPALSRFTKRQTLRFFTRRF